MKEIKLTIEGKEITLTPEQIKALGIDIDDGCVCDRVEAGEVYFYVNSNDEERLVRQSNDCKDEKLFNCGNYYRDKSYAKQVALHQKLNNLLRRYSEQHSGDAPWDGDYEHYMIMFDTLSNTYVVDCYCMSKGIGTVYFHSYEVAEQAIKEVVKPFMKEHPDFVC